MDFCWDTMLLITTILFQLGYNSPASCPSTNESLDLDVPHKRLQHLCLR